MLTRLLANMIEARLRQDPIETYLPTTLAALQLAELALGPIRGWIVGYASCTPESLAQAIMVAGIRMREAMEAADSQFIVTTAVGGEG